MTAVSPDLLVAAVVAFAVFTQSLTGFGSGMVCMSVLPGVLGIRVASPLVALVMCTVEAVLLLRYRHALKVGAVWRMWSGAFVGIPVGIAALRHVDEHLIIGVLGLVLVGYSLYALRGPRLPELEHPGWAYGAGLLGGVLGGAYNSGGPPAIIYGHSRRWTPHEFKSNLQALFLVMDVMVIAGHAAGGNFTPVVWGHYMHALPAAALGAVAGLALDRRIDHRLFGRIVLWWLLVMGIRLLVR